MSLNVGIVGLPNAGKSTLFNALLKRQIANVAVYPFTTIEPNTGVVEVPDERLVALALMVKPEKVTPSSIKFIDIAGLIKGAHKGEGLGNEFLGHIREVNLILHVLRAFDNNVPHPLGLVDPQRDYEVVETELILKDLETVEKIKEKDKKLEIILKKVWQGLNNGKPVSDLILNDQEKEEIKQLALLTAKPTLCILNVEEKKMGTIAGPTVKVLPICAKLEMELATFPVSERKEYLKSLGIEESALDKVIKGAYKTLGLITFYTIKGGKEVRAWSLGLGETALKASEIVHTDMAKGFVKAEVASYNDLIAAGSWPECQEAGKIRLEGKNYPIKDGEVIEFKFVP